MSSNSLSNESYPILKLKNITKVFPGVIANKDVSLTLNSGEILAVLGENGAGKSTLMKVLVGLYQPNSGEIEINLDWFRDGKRNKGIEGSKKLIKYSLNNPRDAIDLGIGMVHQHFQLVEPMTVTENIILGREITKGKTPILDQKEASKLIRKLGDTYGLPIDPLAIIEEISVGLKQRVEILKTLYRDAQLLIFDEPTSVLTPLEVEELFRTLRELKANNKTIIFISHKLKEPLAIADRIVVMRKGEIIGETTPKDTNEMKLAEMLVGRPVLLRIERKDIAPGSPVLTIEDFTIKDTRFHQIDSSLVKESSNNQEIRNAIEKVTFQIRENEIVGIAGVQGNGQSDLIEGLFGLRKEISGSILYYPTSDASKSEELTGLTTQEILEKGIAYVPEDRSTQGIIQDFTVYSNTWLGYLTQPNRAESYLDSTEGTDFSSDEISKEALEHKSSLKNKIFLPFSIMKKFSEKIVKQFEVVTPSVEILIKNLSGGNQQKVLLGREFAKNPRLIIASEPTRGVDIGVTKRVRNSLLKMRDNGSGILLISSDLDEVLSLSDHLLVLYEGKIVGRGKVSEFTNVRISKLMATGQE